MRFLALGTTDMPWDAMHLRAWYVAALAAACAAAFAPRALAGPRSSDPTAALRAAADVDELTLASVVAQLGDDAVLAALTQHEDVLLRATAVRGTTFLRSAALALPALAEIAAGRDPDLAPLAARRARTISLALAETPWRGAEGEKGGLAAVTKTLSALAEAEGAERGIRVSAGEAAAMLAGE
jgi:hypothetical protein